MKLKLALLASLFAATLLSAQTSSVPTLMSYQGRVTDAAGTLIGNTAPVNRTVTFRLYSQPSDGPVLYAETQTVTISGGEFSVLLGNGTGVSGSPGPSTPASPLAKLDAVLNAATTPLYLGITVDDGNASTVDAEIAPRQQLVSGAYALRAAVAERVVDGSVTTDMLGNSSVSTANLQAESVVSSRIANNGVATVNIANSAITAAKLDTGSVGVWTPSGTHLYRNSNVGIGETNPGFPLNFASGLGPKISLYGNAGNHYGFGIQSSLLEVYTSSANADIAFGYGTSGALTERMRIKGNGNVGIGTTSPSAKFHINQGEAIIQNTGAPYLKLTRGDSTYADLGLASGAGSWSSSASVNDTILRSQQKLHLQSGTGSAAMTISTANQIGIGNSSPNANLTVGSNLGGTARSSTLTTNAGALGTSNNSELLLASFGATTGNFSSLGISAYRRPAGSDWTTTSMLLAMNVDNTLRPGGYLAFTPSGLGVNTLDTSQGVLNVGGGIVTIGSRNSSVGYAIMSYRADRGGIAFDVYNTSQGGTTNWRSFSFDGDSNIDFYSDLRLKKDIEFAEPMLDRLMQLPFRRFRWKDGEVDQKHELGVIAQEVEPLFPDIVGKNDDGILTVGYGTFAIIASKALQEMKVIYDAEFAELEHQMAEKDARIADLEARMAALEAFIRSR